MVKSVYKNVRVSGIAAAVSNRWLSTEDSAKNSESSDSFNFEKFIKTTGVRGRYLCVDNQTPSDFCVAAAEKMLSEKRIDRTEIGLIVYVTQSPDYRSPATACVMHKRLELSDSCIAFDLNMGCSGFVVGLNAICGMLIGSSARKALLLCGDLCGQDMDRNPYSDSSYYLFGDAGAAILIEKSDKESDVLTILSATDGGVKSISSPGTYWRHPKWKFGNVMDGVEVFNFAVNRAAEMIKEYMEDANSRPDDYDKLVLHQANLYIMKQVVKRAGFSKEKMAVSIDEYGNTSSVSIPISIVKEYGEDKTGEKKRILTCGFGVGLSWAAVEFSLSVDDIFPIQHTDEWFDDELTEDY